MSDKTELNKLIDAINELAEWADDCEYNRFVSLLFSLCTKAEIPAGDYPVVAHQYMPEGAAIFHVLSETIYCGKSAEKAITDGDFIGSELRVVYPVPLPKEHTPEAFRDWIEACWQVKKNGGLLVWQMPTFQDDSTLSMYVNEYFNHALPKLDNGPIIDMT